MLGEMVRGRMNGLTGCYDVSPSQGSTADAETRVPGCRRRKAGEEGPRWRREHPGPFRSASPQSALPLRACSSTLPEQRGHRLVPVPPSPHVKACVTVVLRVRACFRWRGGADENTRACFRMCEGGWRNMRVCACVFVCKVVREGVCLPLSRRVFDDEDEDDDGVCMRARARTVGDVETFVDKIPPSCNIRPSYERDALQSGRQHQSVALVCGILSLPDRVEVRVLLTELTAAKPSH